MRIPLTLLVAVSALSFVAAEEPLAPASYYERQIFADDFSSNAFGERWGHYKSGSVVKDGMLIGITPENSDHSAVDHIRFDPQQDLEVSVKFRFGSDKAKSFNVWLDDKNYKGSHAGHICSISVTPAAVTIADAKTGNFRNDIYEQKKKPEGLSAEQKALLETKTKRLPVSVSRQEWHALLVRTKGDEIEVSLDGTPAGRFKSEGVGHDSKTLVSLTTNPVDVHYDDFSIRAGGKVPSKP